MFDLTDEQESLRDLAAKLAADVYGPKAIEWDSEASPMPSVERKRLADLDLLGISLPQQYGGGGRPLFDALIVIEELAKSNMLAAWPVFEACTGPARVIDLFGSDEQRQRLLPPVIRGERTIALSISEPDAGSAATDLKTRAEHVGKHLIINGNKRWCSGAGEAEQYLVYVRMGAEPGAKSIGAVVVDRDVAGLTFGPREELMGFRGIPSADMYFEDVQVPEENLIVGPGHFGSLFKAFSIERLGNATMSLAMGQSALDRTVEYVQSRSQFGRPIVEFQMVQATIADMVMRVEAARLLILRAALNAGGGSPNPLQASIAKCTANEMAKVVVDSAIQLHGGYGYSREYELERLYRDACGWALAGGTGNMQRLRIASDYLGRRFEQRALNDESIGG